MMCAMDWPALIKELKDLGLSQQEVASAIGVTQPTISAIATGKTEKLSFDVGDALRTLHSKMRRQAKAKAA